MSSSPPSRSDYADGASAKEIDDFLTASAQNTPIPRQRRDSQVGSAYSGDDNGEGASGAIFDGYGAHAIPSSVTSMHHDRVFAWSHDSRRRSVTSFRRPRVQQENSAASSHFGRRDSGDLLLGQGTSREDVSVFASDDEPAAAASDDDDERRTTRSRTSLQQRSSSQRVRKPSEVVPKSVFDSISGIFSRQSLDASAEPPELSRQRSFVSDGSRRRSRSRRSTSNASAAGSVRASEASDDEELWGYSSGEEDVDSADEASLAAPSYLGDEDSVYARSEGDMRPTSPTTSLPMITGGSDPIFGDTRIDMDVELGYEDFSTQPKGGPPSRQRVYLEDEDMSVLFVGCEVILWRKWVWRAACVFTFGLLGLAGLWIPTLWLKWVTRERAFERLGRSDSGEGLVVVEVSKAYHDECETKVCS